MTDKTYTAEQVDACILAYQNGDLNYCRAGIVDLLTAYAATFRQQAGAVEVPDVRSDAETWGVALNEAAWKFIETCPENSALLFNTCKTALRAAILTYLDKLTATPAAPAEEEPPTCPICDQMKLSARCSACGYEEPTTGAAR